MTREQLRFLDERFAFQTSERFDLLVDEHVPFGQLGAADVDGALLKAIERGEGVISVVGRVGSGKSSVIAAVADALVGGFVPLRVSVIGIEAGDPVAFIRHAITEIRDLPEAQLTKHEHKALDRATATQQTQGRTRELRAAPCGCTAITAMFCPGITPARSRPGWRSSSFDTISSCSTLSAVRVPRGVAELKAIVPSGWS